MIEIAGCERLVKTWHAFAVPMLTYKSYPARFATKRKIQRTTRAIRGAGVERTGLNVFGVFCGVPAVLVCGDHVVSGSQASQMARCVKSANGCVFIRRRRAASYRQPAVTLAPGAGGTARRVATRGPLTHRHPNNERKGPEIVAVNEDMSVKPWITGPHIGPPSEGIEPT